MEALGAISQDQLALILLIQLWELPWKGFALWQAARNRRPGWFIALLLIHLAGLIDIIYIFYISQPVKKRRAIRIGSSKDGVSPADKTKVIEKDGGEGK